MLAAVVSSGRPAARSVEFCCKLLFLVAVTSSGDLAVVLMAIGGCCRLWSPGRLERCVLVQGGLAFVLAAVVGSGPRSPGFPSRCVLLQILSPTGFGGCVDGS